MVLLVTTSRILSALESISPPARQHLNLPATLTLETPISHDQLIRLSRHLCSDDGNYNRTWSLNALLQGTKVYVPPPPPKPEPSPEYLAQKARLLAAAEKDAYNKMMNPAATTSIPFPSPRPSPLISPHNSPSTSPSDQTQDQQEDLLTPSIVLNIFLSVIITGFSVYWALTSYRVSPIRLPFVSDDTKASGGQLSEPVRVLISLAGSVLVAVAESVIYAVYLGKIRQGRVREGRVREKKVVVGREVLGSRDVGDRVRDEVRIEDPRKEEIWGRGLNGGVRRRVRERWEESETHKDDG